MFELNHLRCFVAVAEELHFGRAAARLNTTQPAMSRQVQILEGILAVALLDRTSRSVRLTQTGLAFLPEAQRLLKFARESEQLVRRVDDGTLGSLKIVFTAASAYHFLPDLVKTCMREMSDVDLFLREMVTRDQVDALMSGEADVGLMRPPITRSELTSMRVAAEPLLAAIPDGHRLSRAESVSLDDLEDEPFIMFAAHEARYFHDLVAGLFASARVRPRHVQQLAQIHSILSLVSAGLGCAIAPQSAALIRYEGVHFRPLRLSRPTHAEFHMVWRQGKSNPTVRRLLQVARAM